MMQQNKQIFKSAYTNGAKQESLTNIQCALRNRSSLSFSILVPISILLPLALERESFSSRYCTFYLYLLECIKIYSTQFVKREWLQTSQETITSQYSLIETDIYVDTLHCTVDYTLQRIWNSCGIKLGLQP